MTKLTYEDKKEIIRLYDEEYLGYILIERKMKVNSKAVERIIRKFRIHGESKSSVAIEYNIEPSQIRSWFSNVGFLTTLNQKTVALFMRERVQSVNQ